MQTKSWFLDANSYLLNMVQNNSVIPIQIHDYRLNQVISIVRSWAGDNLNAIKLSGSAAKNLVVSGEADTDIFISLKAKTDIDLKTMFESLASQLILNYLPVEKHTVALQTRDNSLKIDLVPGRVQSGYQNYHSLYNSENQSWLQTNIDEHINTVVNSGRQNEIRAIKIWCKLKLLKFPSIYLELVVLRALYNMNRNQLAANIETVLNYLANDFVDTRIVDPSNTNNKISDYALTSIEKSLISSAAKLVLKNDYWESFLY